MTDLLSVESLADTMGKYTDMAVEIAIYVWRMPIHCISFHYKDGVTFLIYEDSETMDVIFSCEIIQIGPIVSIGCGGPAGEIIMKGVAHDLEAAERATKH